MYISVVSVHVLGICLIFASNSCSGRRLETILEPSPGQIEYDKKPSGYYINNTKFNSKEMLTLQPKPEQIIDCECGQRSTMQMKGSHSKIVNGYGIGISDHPSLAFLLIFYHNMDGTPGTCGGTIINTQYVLTAAHCFVEDLQRKLIIEEIRVYLGLHDQNPLPYLKYYSGERFTHEHFNYSSGDNDIALVKLNESIYFNDLMHPICLPLDGTGFESHKYAYVQGWGLTAYMGAPSRLPNEAKIPLISQKQCEKSHNGTYNWKIKICAGGDNTSDTCRGDSGGPLYVTNTDGTMVQTGITSFGEGCLKLGHYGYYANVRYYLNWIMKHTSDAYYCSVPNHM